MKSATDDNDTEVRRILCVGDEVPRRHPLLEGERHRAAAHADRAALILSLRHLTDGKSRRLGYRSLSGSLTLRVRCGLNHGER